MKSLASGGLAAWLLWASAGGTLAADLPDGTLLFLENCNSVVQWSTGGEVAHVALVFADADGHWVYEATPGKVRRVAYDDYLTELSVLNARRSEQKDIRVVALRPQVAYTAAEAARMRTYLDAQLGRRYSVKNYVRSQPYDGIHCAELAATTLNQSGRYDFQECHKINPQTLLARVQATHATPSSIDIPPLVATEPWCSRMQRSWLGTFAWCRWSGREAWLFLW